MRTRSAAFLAVAVAMALTTCGAAPEPAIDDLDSVAELRLAFEEDAGRPRLVLLLSPT
jgi:hypothetical protein